MFSADLDKNGFKTWTSQLTHIVYLNIADIFCKKKQT